MSPPIIETLKPLFEPESIAVISAGGGHCVVTTDACSSLGLEVPELDDETVKALERYLLPHAPPPKNPIDLAADPRPMTVANIVELLVQNPRIDAVITMAPISIRSPHPAFVREVLSAAEILSDVPQKYGKPLIATAMRGNMHGVGFDLMKERGIPFYEFPEEASRAMAGLYRYSKVQ